MVRKHSLLLAMGATLSVGFVQAIASDTIGEIKRVDGSAMVSQGEQFVAAQAGMKLQELDRLMVLEQSEALLEFQDGCRYVVKENELLTVGATSVCADNTSVTEATDYSAVERTATSQVEAGMNGMDIGAAGFIVAAVAGLTWAFANDDDPTLRPLPPVSPQ
jgi:hypothetical protein